MHVLERGTGKAHLWLHGFLGNSLNLTPMAADLPGCHLFPDARNHGRSAHVADMSIAAMAKDAIAVLDSRGIETAAVIGHSMGGKVALAAACQYPERFTHVILMDIAPVDYNLLLFKQTEDIKFYVRYIQLQQMQAVSLQGKRRNEVAKELNERIRNKKVVELLGTNLQNENGVLKWRCGLANLTRGYDQVSEWSEPEKQYPGKALVLAGEHSFHTVRLPILTKDRTLESLYAKAFQTVEIKVIPGAGHWVHVDQPDLVRKEIKRFLTSQIHDLDKK